MSAELVNVSFDPALETEAREVETAHGPVGLSGPREERIEDREGRINAVRVELRVVEETRSGE